jgi:hypothetical protein
MEVEMRILLVAACILSIGGFGIPGFAPVNDAHAVECTGQNCPPPSGQGGHDCERKKNEQTTS